MTEQRGGSAGGATLDDLAQGNTPGAVTRPVLVDGKFSFRVRWHPTDGGPPQEGVINAHLATLDDDLKIARARANLTGGIAWASLAPNDQMIFESMAVVQVLVDKPKPVFLQRPVAQLDRALVMGIAARIRQEEEEFFRSRPGAGQGTAGKPSVEILPLDGDGDGPADR